MPRGDAAEVDRQRRRGDHLLVVDVRVGSDDHDQVRLRQPDLEVDGLEPRLAQRRDEGIVVGKVGFERVE